MKRIAIVLPDLRGGGAERVAVNLANSFAQRGHEVHVVVLAAAGAFLDELGPEIRLVDLKAKRLRAALLPLVQYLRQSNPTVVLAFMWPLTVLVPWARTLARVSTRVVVAEHTTWSRDEIVRSWFGRWQARMTMHYTFPHADGLICVSHGAASDLALFANLDRKSISVIYNPVVGEDKPTAIGPLSPAGWWTGSHYKLLAVGALKQIKDHATLLNAFALLRQWVNSRLLILGEGDCRLALEAQVRQLGIEASVFMPGFVKDPSPYYQQADLHVLSSIGEGFGNVIVEALAAGTPVVSTDCPSGPREILRDGQFGRLVPVGDAAAMAAAMAESLTDAHDTDTLKNRARDFSIEKATDRYLKLMLPQASPSATT